ncbi:hypothetical protein PV328_005892 [Microctonus aethiopoides]|uniref:ABC transmembrane type-1 domain-containing protein n=1 Tax=Microctonus aethiopoides TaxID=144406 RepID=A0AA39FMZ2_9HYME|nr:hypothetical protein PV328_005892 [Microctonus aethiopoides]
MEANNTAQWRYSIWCRDHHKTCFKCVYQSVSSPHIRITDCITDWKKINITKMDGNIREKMKKNPREGANFFNAVTYTWMLEIFHLGYKRDLELEDLYEPLKEHKSNIMGDKLAAVWRNHLESCKKKNSNKNNIPINLRRVLIRVFGARFAFYGLIALLMEVVMRVIQPLVLGRFVQYFIDDNISVNEAYIYASCIILTAIINVIFEIMDTGSIVEFDHPHILLQNESGFFSNMVRETGNTSAKILAAIAKETYEKYQSISTSTIYTSKNKPTFDTVF